MLDNIELGQGLQLTQSEVDKLVIHLWKDIGTANFLLILSSQVRNRLRKQGLNSKALVESDDVIFAFNAILYGRE